MRKLNRQAIAIPTSLGAPSNTVSGEKTNAESYYGGRVPWQESFTAYPFRQYKPTDVKAAILLLANGNCAYCESKISGTGAREVEHYRPKGGIDGISNHPGYWWLALAWENLLPTCRHCNQGRRQNIVVPGMSIAQVEALTARYAKTSHGKANQFEIRGIRAIGSSCDLSLEDPLLIDPCHRDPSTEITWNFGSEITLIEPKWRAGEFSVYGAYTIRTCALNRAELVLNRVSPVRTLRAMRTLIIKRLEDWKEDAEVGPDISAEVALLGTMAMPDQPYAGMVSAFIKELMEELERWRVARGLPPFT